MFVAVQGSCTYAGTKLCLNDHYHCETFCLGWTIHHCNTTPMWGLISLQVLIEHLPQLAWMPTYGIAIRDFRHQRAVYLESLLWHEFNSNCSLPCQCHLRNKVWTPAIPNLIAGPIAGVTTNGQLAMIPTSCDFKNFNQYGMSIPEVIWLVNWPQSCCIYICILPGNFTWKLVQTTIHNYSSHQHKVVRVIRRTERILST